MCPNCWGEPSEDDAMRTRLTPQKLVALTKLLTEAKSVALGCNALLPSHKDLRVSTTCLEWVVDGRIPVHGLH